MKYILITLITLVGCSRSSIPNYKVVNGQYQVWRYTRPGEPTKDIMSTGDTIYKSKDTLYIIKRKQ